MSELSALPARSGLLGTRRTIGPALYLLLALALVAMVLLSVLVNERIQRSVFQSVATTELWAGKFNDIATLGGLVSAFDAPGNDVFRDGDPVGNRAKMRAADDSAVARIARLRVTLPIALPAKDSTLVLADLDWLAGTLPKMRQEAEAVFATFTPGAPTAAAHHMAEMDNWYGASLAGVRRLRADLVQSQARLITAE